MTRAGGGGGRQVNLQDLAETNNISNPDLIAADSVLFIPDVNYIVDDVLTTGASAGELAGTLRRHGSVTSPA